MERIRVDPSFILKSIDPTELFKRYTSGEFFNLSVPISLNLETSNLYSIRNWCIDYTLYSVGRFVDFYTNKEYSELPKIGCYWCHLPISHIIGIPIEIATINNETVYKMIDYYCSFQCAMAAINENNKLMERFRNPKMKDSEVILRFLYDKICPGKRLVPSPDFRLLKANGGPLTEEEYFGGSGSYVKLFGTIGVPCKCEFLLLDAK